MNTLNAFISGVAMVVVSTLSLGAPAQAAEAPVGDANIVVAQTSTTDMTDGEIRKVDKDTKKITIKHGEIKNLDMPGMTMLFQVKDAAMLDTIKPGDKVKFRAEKLGGAIVVTEIQVAN